MVGELLATYYQNYFANIQPTVHKEEEILEQVIFKSPFITAQSLFDDFLPSIESDRFYALSLVGPQGKGKTKLASIFGTIAEDNKFLVVYAKAEDIFNDLQGWADKVKSKLAEWETDRLCLILDDMSYTSETISKKQSAIFKHFIADVRHVFEHEGFKPRVFMVYISHRLHSLPPMLRNSGSWIFSSMQSADREDAIKLIARRKEMREKLDAMYEFISKVSIDGPKYKTLNFNFGDNEMEFVWGTESDPGDGRLMVTYHAGDIKIFNSKILPEMIDIESDLYRIRYSPPPPQTEAEIKEQKRRKEEALRIRAEELFPINEKFNNNSNSENIEVP